MVMSLFSETLALLSELQSKPAKWTMFYKKIKKNLDLLCADCTMVCGLRQF